MAFKTICISGKKLKAVIFIPLAAIVTALAIKATLNAGETVEVFNDIGYTDILDESLPSEESSFNIKKFIDKIIGFDAKEPQSIIKNFSPVFEADETPQPISTEVPLTPTPTPAITDSPTAAPISQSIPQFPSKEEISAGVGLELNNATSYSVNLKELCAKELDFNIEKNSEPQVLIMHTHTTECFNGDAMNGETERNADESKNMIAVGEVIAQALENNGIHCVHDKTVHDYPSYHGAYTRALSTIDYNLKQYPQIKIVLDIHRDAFIYPDGSKLTVTCNQNGVATAKVMQVVGTDSLGLSHPNWRDNLTLAAKIQSAANIMYPQMMRPINLRRERFNMHMTKGSLLLEIGSNGNTIEEAKEAGGNIANVISAVLSSL